MSTILTRHRASREDLLTFRVRSVLHIVTFYVVFCAQQLRCVSCWNKPMIDCCWLLLSYCEMETSLQLGIDASMYKHVLANISHSRIVARTPPVEAHSPRCRSNVENAPLPPPPSMASHQPASHALFPCMYVCMYPLGMGPAYSGPIRWGLFIAGPLH